LAVTEQKAKQAEEERRLIARRAREDHKKAVRRLKTESQIIGNFTVTFEDVRRQFEAPTSGGMYVAVSSVGWMDDVT